MAFVIAQAASADQLGPAVGASGTLGYQGMTGYAVEFDTYQNGSDPSGNHIAWMQASTGTHLLVGEPAFTLACGLRAPGRHPLHRDQPHRHRRRDQGGRRCGHLHSRDLLLRLQRRDRLINDRHAIRDFHLTLGAVGSCI